MKRLFTTLVVLAIIGLSANAQVPTVTITASANPICLGDTLTLTAHGATTYIWSAGLGTSNPVTVIPAFGTTTYYVTGTTTGGTGSATITITVNPNPTVSVTASVNPICMGHSATLTATGASTYEWDNGLGASCCVIATPTTTTTYTVVGNMNGCTNTASVTIVVDSCAGISEYNNDNNIAIYPNPATDKIEVRSMQEAVGSIEITNIKGQIIEILAITDNKTNIDISTLARGMYFVKVKTEKGVAVKKFVKE